MATRPRWQHDDCPNWCTGDHHENDHKEDRVHHSAGIAVPVITKIRGDGAGRAEVTDFEVGLTRRDGEAETWIYIGDGPGNEIEVSVESAQRLIEVLNAEVPDVG